MRTIVLVLRDPDSAEVSLRCEAHGAFLWRLRAADGQSAALVADPADPGADLAELATTGGLLGDGDDVRYVPTRLARDRVAADEDGAWPKAVASRQRKLVRRSQGAIFHFSLETGGAVDDTEAACIEAFVTDWTGMPSACAMAIHPAHPLSPGLAPGEQASFTGRHCRHPLTGDLLPIWVADWVKAEFGTGAVVLNPGHNQVDMEFSRQVGLPIRFALGPDGYDGSPGQWVTPPFIRSGVAVRTGSTDGLPYDQAGNVYVQTVAERGLADLYTDSGMGTFRVAGMDPDGTTEVAWDRRRRTVAAPGQPSEPVLLVPSPVLSAVEEPVRGSDLVVVAPSTQVEGDLLALRLLLAEPGIEPAVKSAPKVVVVGNVVSIKEQADDAVLRLAMLVNAGALDTIALKPQQIEPCERFLEVHAELTEVTPTAGQVVSAEVGKAGQIKGLLVRGDLKQAFTQLYRLQKGLAKSETVSADDLLRYQALAHVLAGVSGPYPQETVAEVWQRL